MSNDKSTTYLFNLIKSDSAEFMEGSEFQKLSSYDNFFVEFFYRLLEEKHVEIKDILYKVPISNSYLYQVTSKRRRMGRDVAIMIALVLQLTLEETQNLLKYSNNGILYPKIKRDAIIICCLECKMTLEEANDKLNEHSEKGLY